MLGAGLEVCILNKLWPTHRMQLNHVVSKDAWIYPFDPFSKRQLGHLSVCLAVRLSVDVDISSVRGSRGVHGPRPCHIRCALGKCISM